MMWLLSLPVLAAPQVAYQADMVIQLHGPTFGGRLHGELLLTEDAFLVSVLGPAGSELAVFIGDNQDVSGALLAEGVQFSTSQTPAIMAALSQNQLTELNLPTFFLALWPCDLETVDCREKSEQPKKVTLGNDALMLHYPNYKNIDGVELPVKIRADLPTIDWKLRFHIKNWSEVPYQAAAFEADFPEPEIEKEFVPTLEEMVKNSLNRKSEHPE